METPAPMAMALSDIPTRAADTSSLLDQTQILLSRSTIFDAIEDELSLGEQTIADGMVRLDSSLAAAASRQAISELEQGWAERERSLEGWEQDLRKRSVVMEQQLSLLDSRLGLWRRTLVEAEANDAPDELIALARNTFNELQDVKNALAQMQERVLALQGKVGRANANVQEVLGRIATEEADLLRNLVRREREPLWSEALADVSARQLVGRARYEITEWWSSLYGVVRSEPDRVVFQLLLIAIIAFLLRGSRKSARNWSANDPSVASGMSVFERPVALAALGSLMLTPWIYLSPHAAVEDAVGLLLVLPILSVVLPLLEKRARPALYVLAILYVTDLLRDLVEAAPLVARLIFIFEMAAAIVLVIWLIRSRALLSANSSVLQDRLRFGLHAALLLLIVAMLAALAGFVRLSVLIGGGVLNSAYLALLFAAFLKAADAVIALALHSQFAQGLNVVSNRTSVFRRRANYVLMLTAIFVWLVFTLEFFALRDGVSEFASGILFTEFKAGAIAISLADVLAFVVTIFATVLIARLITTILEEDVYNRMELGRGVPLAISSVVKYSVITLGFLLAVGAMGIGMDRITILLGAFGVGVGFGLQNVVNNFVSGLILIFERPVQVGDSVVIGSVTGTIRRIGIRSSTVRSFDGADITIPNGILLSEPLSNWTMSDRARRIDVVVGVVYGTDPDEVIAVLKGALQGQEGLLDDPEPQVLFTGFGDSSLDFVLRAWVADNDEFVKTQSSLALAVNRGLNESGIEIPFPQRDLHLRSVSPDVSLREKL